MRSSRKLAVGFLATFLALGVKDLRAQQGTFCGNPFNACDPEKPGSNCYQPPPEDPRCEPIECGKCNKSPCAVASGTYSWNEVDLRFATVGVPLEAKRHYSTSKLVDGALGVGWTSNLLPRVHSTTFLLAPPNEVETEVVVVMPEGVRYRFRSDGSGGFAPPIGRYDQLTQAPNGAFELRLQRSRTVLRFGADGKLQEIEDGFENVISYDYGIDGRLERVADESGSGRFLDVYWGADGRLDTVVDHSGRVVDYEFDSNGMLVEVIDPLERSRSYEYEARRYARLLTATYDPWGRPITEISYDAKDRVSSYTDAGETWTYAYQYQGASNKTAKSDSVGNTWIYTHGAGGLVTDIQQPTGAGGSPRHASYNADGSVASVLDPKGVRTDYAYDSFGRVTAVTYDKLGPTAIRYEYTYDPTLPYAVTHLIAVNPASGQRNLDWQSYRFSYFQEGETAEGALKQVFRLHGDGVNEQLVSTLAYDTRGRVLSRTDALGEQTQYFYDGTGNLESISFPPNNAIGLRPIYSYSYDDLGRVLSSSNPLGETYSFEYDAIGRVVSVEHPQPTPGFPGVFLETYSYDNYDVSTELVGTVHFDFNGKQTRIERDQFDRVVRFVDGPEDVTSLSYSRGLLDEVTDAHNYRTEFGYDSLRRPSQIAYADGTAESFTYHPDGLRMSWTDRNQNTTNFGYDNLKRLVSVAFPDSTGIAYSYLGQKGVQIVDTRSEPDETSHFTYDALYRLETETQGARGTISYSYSPTDRLASYSFSGGPATAITRNPDGSTRSLSWSEVGGEFNFFYDLHGRYERVVLPNGLERSYEFDSLGRLVHLENSMSGGSVLAAFDYDYDRDEATGALTRLGLRTKHSQSITPLAIVGAESKYFFDGSYNLTGVDYPPQPPFDGSVHRWTYDAMENRTSASVNGQAHSYSYQQLPGNGSNWRRLLATPYFQFGYDSAGNVETINGSAGVQELTWDYLGRLVASDGASAAEYSYDFRGRRSRAEIDGSSSTFLYFGRQAAGEYSDGNWTWTLFGPGIDQPLAASGSEGIRYYLVDGLGSVVGAVDSAGQSLWARAYGVWGEVFEQGGTRSDLVGFTGREDGPQGLLYYRARHYMPEIGRFLQEDPPGPFTRGLYQYVDNNPVWFVDPLGLDESDPIHGRPNTWWWSPKKNGGGGTLREFGDDGRALRDFDWHRDHGLGPEHVHEWDWTKHDLDPSIGPERPGRPFAPEEPKPIMPERPEHGYIDPPEWEQPGNIPGVTVPPWKGPIGPCLWWPLPNLCLITGNTLPGCPGYEDLKRQMGEENDA